MSQSSNHVKWCINKANEEIKECERLGKRKKHRGLLKLNPDQKTAKKHLDKAKHNLEAVYGIKISPDDKEKFKELINDCKNIMDITKELIYN